MKGIDDLTHWGRVTHICVSKLTIIGSDNGLSPGRRQAIIWTSDGILLVGHMGTNVNEILIKIHTFSFMKIHLKMSSGKWWPFCLGLNVAISRLQLQHTGNCRTLRFCLRRLRMRFLSVWRWLKCPVIWRLWHCGSLHDYISKGFRYQKCCGQFCEAHFEWESWLNFRS